MKFTSIKMFITVSTVIFLFLSCSKGENNEIIEEDINPPVGTDTTLNKKPLGESANDLLSNSKFDKLILDIMYFEGYQPTSTAINNFKSFLQNRLNKASIIINQRNIGSPTKNVYSINDIKTLEDAHREHYNSSNEIAVSGIFVNGEYSENTSEGKVLGVAYRNTSFVIFEETIEDFSSGVLSPSQTTLETVVINHEFGHILGLVNVGSPMQNNHQDTTHGKHCDNDNCLMFWTAETGEGLVNMISGGSVPELDANCIADLQANGGK